MTMKMNNNSNILHKCANCPWLNESDTYQCGYGKDIAAWCEKCKCYVCVNGTCVGEDR